MRKDRDRIDPLLDDPEDLESGRPRRKRDKDIDYDEPSRYDFDTNEAIWKDYGISPKLGLKVKVEKLITIWRIDAYEIARLLKIDIDEAEKIIQELEAEWAQMGRLPSADQRDVARGQMIAELRRMANSADMVLAAENSAVDQVRLLQLKMSCINQITALQGLAPSKGELITPEEIEDDPVTKIIDELSPEDQKALFQALEESDKCPTVCPAED